MLVLNPNNVKIYNLSCAKSLPEWLSERKRRLAQKKDVECRRRIELIQDFNMPGVSTGIKVSRNGQYIIASGIYKPRVRCFDVKERSMKFERCFDSECVKFELLSDDYSKIVLLLSDRSVEFHAQYGRYYQTRIPKFGRDMTYHFQYCDLYFVGASSEVYRLNLEQGKYLSSLQTSASSINKCTINPVHHLLACGTVEGKVEAWDPRSRNRIGILDCAISSITEDTEVNEIPSITALNFRDGITMAVGTATGKVLLYDIRSHKPFLVKDHMYGLPIKSIDFIEVEDLVASLDSKCVKFWDQRNGKPFSTIQPTSELNDMCIVPNTGMLFLANEDKRILTYYIPSIGPAPQWCHYLDNVIEQLEESPHETVYDDYKFVTKKELEDLGLSHLFGSNLLRAYMHGYFMDIRLYNKAKAIVQPFAYKDFQKKKIREKIDNERSNRVKMKKLPTVNAEYALNKLMENNTKDKLNQKTHPSVLEDRRFKALFEDPEYARDETAEEYKYLQPLIAKQEKNRKRKSMVQSREFELVEDENTPVESETSSDDEKLISDEEQILKIKNKRPGKTHAERIACRKAKSKPKFYQIKDSEKFTSLIKGTLENKRETRLSFGERLCSIKETVNHNSSVGNKIVTFMLKKSESNKIREDQSKCHLQERAQLHRPVRKLRNTTRKKHFLKP